MNWQSGLIIRINNYRFDDDGSQRDKYAIVLKTNNEESYIIHCLTTSRNNAGVTPNGHGCNVERNIPYYFIEANRVIGNEGYFFEKDTFIFFSQNVRREAIDKLEKISPGPVRSCIARPAYHGRIKKAAEMRAQIKVSYHCC